MTGTATLAPSDRGAYLAVCVNAAVEKDVTAGVGQQRLLAVHGTLIREHPL